MRERRGNRRGDEMRNLSIWAVSKTRPKGAGRTIMSEEYRMLYSGGKGTNIN